MGWLEVTPVVLFTLQAGSLCGGCVWAAVFTVASVAGQPPDSCSRLARLWGIGCGGLASLLFGLWCAVAFFAT